MKKLMLGNEAVARGLYEAGCRIISSYPGTPSTEITEAAATYEAMYAEWAPNEKVACEVAIGASIGGARSFCAMKHVGLNVAADPLYTASYTGVTGGMVVAVADDPGMHSSQNEQDSRHHAIGSKLPMVEPSDSQECIDFIKAAYAMSEEYDTPVLFRTCTRVAHAQSAVELSERVEVPVKPYAKDMRKYVMMPAMAIARHVVVEERMRKLAELAETTNLNRVEMNDTRWGIVTSGTCYQYVKEAFPDASVLKLGLVNPLPTKLFADFAAKVDKLYVVEELDGIIEAHLLQNGIRVDGGKAQLGLLGEFSQRTVAAGFGQAVPEFLEFGEPTPARPPVLCPGCPHRGVFFTLHKMGLMVFGDIGCYTLGALPPLGAMDATICMGASVSGIHGFNLAQEGAFVGKSVAVIGDSTFMHSGITGLVNVAYNQGHSTVIVLDNSITGMTGHQQNPTTGLTLKNQPTPQVSIEAVCRAAGIPRVRVEDPGDLKSFGAAVKEELAAAEASVIIARSPCVLLKEVKPKPPLHVEKDSCKNCGACMRIGCPAIHKAEGCVEIDETLCIGCDLCVQMCGFGSIQGNNGEVRS